MSRGKQSFFGGERGWLRLFIPALILFLLALTAKLLLPAPTVSREPGPTPSDPGPALTTLVPEVGGQTGPSASQPEAKPTPSSAPVPTPTPVSTPTPPPVPAAPSEEDQVEALLSQMTLREKVYQLFVVFPSSITGVSKVTAAGETTRKALETYPVGGFLYDKSNMVSRSQVTEMLAKTQSYAKIPMLFTCDEEGGRVNRLMSTVGTTWVDAMLDYRDEGAETARENASTIAEDLVSCGFNMDFAPVADVWSNPQNTVIGDRAYSDDFEEAATLIPAAVEGFHEGGVACTLKHFPGHGDTSADSHSGSVYVYKTLEELREDELLPFQAGIDAGADAVMVGHLILSEIDAEPAPFSYTIVTELLREEMGFQGVVITDSLQMQALTDYYSSAQIAVKAVKAGVDMLLCPVDLRSAAQALMDAVETGEISQERLDESVRRVLTLKANRGLLSLMDN